MIRKSLISLLIFLVIGLLVFIAGSMANDSVSLPKAVSETSSCPAVGCISGSCHGYNNVPEPDGIHSMNCPKASCSSTSCHAWSTLLTTYNQPSDFSLNLWILAPIVIVVLLILIVRKL